MFFQIRPYSGTINTQSRTQSKAYSDGFKAGRADKLIGWRSEYVWATKEQEGEYAWSYALGYRVAQLGKLF